MATVNIAGGPSSIQGGGQQVSVSAVVADPGENGTFTYSWTATGGSDSYSQTGTSGTFSFDANCAASYSVSLTVTDSDGNTASASSVTIPYGGPSGCSGASTTPFRPDVPTLTIEECEADGTPDSTAVPAGSPAYFQVSVGANNMPAEGTVKAFYCTQDGNARRQRSGSAHANTDYTASGDQYLTFTYASGYAPQIIKVNTMATSNGGTFSLLVPYFLDPCAPTTNDSAESTASATATIEADPCCNPDDPAG